jgi:hypothetical protein
MHKIKYIWLLLVVITLTTNMYNYTVNPEGDAVGNIVFILGILCFPLSIIPTIAILSFVGYSLPEASNPYVFGGICISYVIILLIQWFWLAPFTSKLLAGASHNK